ncbi:MAG: DUF5343 domain-containing protein [Novosphingobium sp.]|jgi:hypothetical protein|nr:DUF5343 domain-containing protein [Novosphingobium sp.]
MALTNAYVLANGRIPDVFAKIRDGQAPEYVTNQLLKDWGFSSSNDRAFIPLLKALGFLSATGQPTQRYHDYRDHSRSKAVMADALRDAYHDLFLITSNPKEGDREAIKGKFKSYHNASDNTASNMTTTFYALLKIADLSESKSSVKSDVKKEEIKQDQHGDNIIGNKIRDVPSFHYNIQVHLPATKDVEVYNAIFKSLREHFVE